MSAESREPEGIVRDGVDRSSDGTAQGEPAPVARGESPAASPAGSGSPVNQAAAGAKDATKTTGPAEEQDEQTGDDRGLTTDSSPD